MKNTIDFILTTAASELISKVLSGKTLNFTRMAVGDGFNYDTTVAKGYTTLVNEVLSIDITKKETLSASSVKITSAFKNTDTQKEFYYREVGLFAQDPDTGEEVLYAYGNRNDAAELITPSYSSVITKQLAFIIAVGNSANITFNVNANVYALQEDMVKTQADITMLNSTKADKDSLVNGLNPKDGVKTYAELQALTTKEVGDYYWCSDGDGVYPEGNYRWTGTSWSFCGTGDEGYNIVSSDIKKKANTSLFRNILDYSNDYNLYNPNNGIVGAYIGSSTGKVTFGSSAEGYVVTELIDVSKYEYIVVRYNKAIQLGLYNSDGFIVRLTGSDTPVNVLISLTYNNTKATHIRAQFKLEPDGSEYDYSKTMIYGGLSDTDVRKPYVPCENVFIPKDSIQGLTTEINDMKEVSNSLFSKIGIKQCAWRGCTWDINPSTQLLERYAPENSMPAFRKAIEKNFDFLWIAVVQYANDYETFYACHDSTTANVSSTNITFRTSTPEEIDAVRLNSRGWIKWEESDLIIPKLENVFKLAYRNGINLGIRLGSMPDNTDNENRLKLWNSFIKLCERYDMSTCIYSGDANQIAVLHSYKPNWIVQLTGDSTDTVDTTINNLKDLSTKGYKYPSYIVYSSALDESVMQKARELGIRIFAVADEPTITNETLEKYGDLCVDGVITHSKLNFNY